MSRLPRAVFARIRAKARLEQEQEEESGERAVRPPPTADQKLRWLGSETLRAPTAGHVDVVKLRRKR